MVRVLIWAPALSLLFMLGAVTLAHGDDGAFSPHVDAAGAITLPEPASVRARWAYLGTYAVQGADGVEEFHAVYTQPGTVDAYRNTGAFPDGAVLVKEVRRAVRGELTTGNVAWSGEPVLWFVMIKDREGRFADNAIWAKGWTWALFLAEDPATNVATDFREDCMTCHEPAQDSDCVYSEGYPVLKD